MNVRPRIRQGLWLLLAAALVFGLAYQLGRATGVRLVAVGVEVLVLIGIRLSIGRADASPVSSQDPDPNTDFTRYRHFVSALRFADNGRFDFDRAARPALLRLYSQVLAQEHDVRLSTDRDRARELAGPAALLLVENSPARLRHDDRREAMLTSTKDTKEQLAVTRKSLEDMVSRLEELSR